MILNWIEEGFVIYNNYTLRIQAISLVESHDLLEDRRTKLRHTKPYPCNSIPLLIL